MSGDPSVEPLSTTIARARGGIRANTQGSAAASSRHGSTMSITSGTLGAAPAERPLPIEEGRGCRRLGEFREAGGEVDAWRPAQLEPQPGRVGGDVPDVAQPVSTRYDRRLAVDGIAERRRHLTHAARCTRADVVGPHTVVVAFQR